MKKSRMAAQIVIHAILILLAVICLTPFLSMISSSFMDIRGVLPDIPVIFPKFPLYVENYVKVWTANNFSRYRRGEKGIIGISTARLCQGNIANSVWAGATK